MIGAVDIGGTKLSVGIVDANGVVLAKMDAPTGSDSTYAIGLERTVRMLRETAKQASTNIVGIGIGSTGPVDPLTGEFGEVDFLPDWRHKNLVKDLAQAFGVQVALENDGDAGVLGEAGWGAGKGMSRLIYVTIGTGIGGGIILDGKLYRGVDGAHPEVGHQVIDPSGPLCSCGFHGCWEALAAGPAMVAWFHATDDEHRQNITGQEICELALAGDPSALRVVQREGRYLGLGLANLINLFTPDMIVLGGSVTKCAVLLLEEIRRTICRGCRFVPYEKAVLALASLGDDANLIGAARVWHHRFAREV